MRTISIGVSLPKKTKLFSELIKFWMRAPYSHAYIKLEGKSIPDTVYHASHGMVHFKELSNFLKDNTIYKEVSFDISDEKYIKILNDCIHIAGEQYDYIDLFKIIMNDVAHSLGKNVSSYDGPGYICSELVGKIMIEKLGFIFNKPAHLLTPKDIYNIIEDYG